MVYVGAIVLSDILPIEIRGNYQSINNLAYGTGSAYVYFSIPCRELKADDRVDWELPWVECWQIQLVGDGNLGYVSLFQELVHSTAYDLMLILLFRFKYLLVCSA